MPPKTNEVLVIDDAPQSAVKRDVARASDPLELLRMAIERGSDVGAIERLMAVRQQLNAETSKALFDRAMADFQRECPVIEKTKLGAKGAYKYAPLDCIIAQVRELIHKHGFSFGVTSEIKPGFLKAVCKITHKGGHSEPSVFEVPIDNKNPMMTDPQRYGGAMTFAKRYAFCNGFGILTADEDIDGAGSRPKPAGPSAVAPADNAARDLAIKIWNILAPIGGDKKDWKARNEWLWREDVLDSAADEAMPNLSAAKLAKILPVIESKMKGAA